MDQIELLWELQKHDSILQTTLKKLKEYTEGKEIEELQVKQQQLEYDITNNKTQREVNNAKIDRLNNKISNLSFTLKDIERKLYSGHISDLKQLDHLNKESQNIKNEIKQLEAEIITLMEEEEILNSKISETKVLYEKLIDTKNTTTNKNNLEIKRLEKESKKEKQIIDELFLKIKPDIINKYNIIKESKGKAISEVVIDKCTGCHMFIPTSILGKINNNDSIVLCDNCGRILYMDKVTN